MVNQILSVILFITSLFTYASSASELTRSDEKYFFEMNGETLSDGSQVYMRYDVDMFYEQKKAHIRITTWHAPVSCDGDYNMQNNNKEYVLVYTGGDDGCAYPSPQFHIKKKGNHMYIKGEPLVYGQGGWLRLTGRNK
ncbi:TPA: hypothetical protein ACSW15_002727 [Enterobacter hormaechei]|uniref:hypothetical protein n=1 Tax=Enterobacter hormaechei TaxID=158836 RepID=UPI000735D929|nr:hypothetical protein [Enterobacter hormaechei]ELT7765787.1 hypothetical protein [Enterobacter hormaechei]ELZ9370030.1 hypothetical protein [Enterobacter hormaechei]MBW7611687.1 hypothetical protein [Enterobacter hormaechei]HAS9375872.1 hypothetical protein [Enterobacter hormaechei]HAV1685597.1 hypothetical protein [Enterobacter hormaechei subsp. steigerwaltii]